MAETTSASARFPSFPDLQREHTELMRRLRPSGEPMDESQRRSLIGDFIERAKNTGAILDGDERQAAQSILDYWSAEIVSASDIDDKWDLPKLLPFEGRAERSEPPADVIQKRVQARRDLELAAAARLWKSSDNDGYLLAGRALEEAAAHQTDPDVAELVRASRVYVDGKERERRLKRRWFAAVMSLALIALVLAACAQHEAENARKSEQSALRAVGGLLKAVYPLARMKCSMSFWIKTSVERGHWPW